MSTTWWNSKPYQAAHVTLHTDWFEKRLMTLKNESGVDSFKFVAGETDYMPKVNSY